MTGQPFTGGWAPSAVARAANCLDILATGRDGHIYTTWWNSNMPTWASIPSGSWENLGGQAPPGAPVCLVARDANHLDAFVTGSDGDVFTTWWNSSLPTWQSISSGGTWENLGGANLHGLVPPFTAAAVPGAPVAAVARDANHLDIFLVGSNGHVYTTWWNSSMPTWQSLSGDLAWEDLGGQFPPGAPVAAVARDANHLDIFAVGSDGHVYTIWWNSSLPAWASVSSGGTWENVGGQFPPGAPVAAVARDANHLDIFLVGGNGTVYTTFWNSSMPAWQSIAHPGGAGWPDLGLNGQVEPGAPVAAVARDANHLDIFAVGPGGHVYTTWWNTSMPTWASIPSGNWENLGGVFPPDAPVAAVARDANHLDIFVTASNGHTYTTWWNSTMPGWQSIVHPGNPGWPNLGGLTGPAVTQLSWGPFGTGPVSDSATVGSDGNECQYQVSLSISQNGTCTFSGYYENRGDVSWGTAPPQGFIVAMFVFDEAGKCYTFANTGEVPSAPQPGCVAEWNITQNCPAIAQNWDSIAAKNTVYYYWYNKYDESVWQWLGTDGASALNWLIQNGPSIVQDAEEVVQAIIEIAAAVSDAAPPPPLPEGVPTGAAAAASGGSATTAATVTTAETATPAGA